MQRAWAVALLVGVGLVLAGGSQAKTVHPGRRCGQGYARRSVRVPERKHGRVVRRHGKIVYMRVRRCVKVHHTKTSPPLTPPPMPSGSVTPVATSVVGASPPATTTTPSPPPPPPTPKANPCPAPVPGDTLQLGRSYARAGEDTFTKDASTGSFTQEYVPDANDLTPIYTGDHGMGWSAYSDGWPSTYTGAVEGYQPSSVLSVHDGVLDFYLHDNANGNPVGASASPWPGGNEYQTYGAYSFCEKVVPTPNSDLADFYEASLLWPQNDLDYTCAESDFPETYAPDAGSPPGNGGSLDDNALYAFAHYATWSALSGCPSATDAPPPDSWTAPIDLHQWHVYTQEWGPGYRSYYIDGKYAYTSTSQVWSQPERWQLQMEPSPSAQVQKDGGTGHVYISWVWIGKPDY